MTKKEIKTLDSLSRECAIQKYGSECAYCRKRSPLNVHHIFSRSKKSVRWDMDNLIVLCAGCHTLGNNSFHKNPIESIEWLKEKRGITWYQKLRLKANQISKPDYNLEKLYLEIELQKQKDKNKTL